MAIYGIALSLPPARHRINLHDLCFRLRSDPRLISLDLPRQHDPFPRAPASRPHTPLAAVLTAPYGRPLAQASAPVAPSSPHCRVACPGGGRARRAGVRRWAADRAQDLRAVRDEIAKDRKS